MAGLGRGPRDAPDRARPRRGRRRGVAGRPDPRAPDGPHRSGWRTTATASGSSAASGWSRAPWTGSRPGRAAVVTDFAVVASPTCGDVDAVVGRARAPGRDARRRRLGGALDRGLVVRGARRAGRGVGGLGGLGVRSPDAPRCWSSRWPRWPSRRSRGSSSPPTASPPGCSAPSRWPCGVAALLVTRPGQRAARTVALTLTALGGAVAATAKVGYLPVLVAAVVAARW